MLPRISFAAILGLVAAALGATTTLEVWDQSAGVGKMEKSRVWYGDGNFYIGPVPSSMKNVMDFLVSDSSDNRLEMIPDSSSKTSTFTLAAGSTFLAVDTTPDSISKPLFTANPDSRLDPGTTMDFAATQGLVYVHEPDSTVAAAKFYLEAVPGTDGKTKMLKWCADQVACEKAGAIWVALVRVDGATKAVL